MEMSHWPPMKSMSNRSVGTANCHRRDKRRNNSRKCGRTKRKQSLEALERNCLCVDRNRPPYVLESFFGVDLFRSGEPFTTLELLHSHKGRSRFLSSTSFARCTSWPTLTMDRASRSLWCALLRLQLGPLTSERFKRPSLDAAQRLSECK